MKFRHEVNASHPSTPCASDIDSGQSAANGERAAIAAQTKNSLFAGKNRFADKRFALASYL